VPIPFVLAALVPDVLRVLLPLCVPCLYNGGMIVNFCARCTTRKLRWVVVLLLLSASAADAQSREPLTVMSFNIRYGTAKDGENHWTARRDLVFDVLREQDADLVGLQEALASQIDEIVAAVPAYAVVGVGRDDAARKGEFSAILFRKDRLHVAEAGTFWFSDTPAVPGSRSWGNNITRISTWARFVDRDGRGFYHFNVHLDHESQVSREQSTALLRQRLHARSLPREPVVVTGDFNVGEENPALATLIEGFGPDAPPTLVDTFRVLHPGQAADGTYTAFKFGHVTGDKIDYVFVPPGTEVLSASIVRTSRNGRYPSDHFPVVARVRLAEVR
jgi:endonuclease/exonuclease/phosphatase family metal-dependent hydrolase